MSKGINRERFLLSLLNCNSGLSGRYWESVIDEYQQYEVLLWQSSASMLVGLGRWLRRWFSVG